MNDGSIDHIARMSTMDFSHDTKFAQSQYLFKVALVYVSSCPVAVLMPCMLRQYQSEENG